MTTPPKLHIIRCLTDVAKENSFVAVKIFVFLFKFMALDTTLSYSDGRSLISELRLGLDDMRPLLPFETAEDIEAYLVEFDWQITEI